MKNSLERRIAQRNALHSFLKGHSEDFYIQVNFCAPRSAEHVCVGLAREDADEIRRIVEEFLIKATS